MLCSSFLLHIKKKIIILFYVDFKVEMILDADGTLSFVQNTSDYPDPLVAVNAGGTLGKTVRISSNTGEALSLAEVQVFQGIEDVLLSV